MNVGLEGRSQAGRTTVIAAIVLLLAVGGAIAWYSMSTAPKSTRADDVVDRALALADPDSTSIKTKWVESVPEFDVTGLTPAQHEVFVRFINARFCDCGCGYTLGACQNFDPTCEFSGPLVEALADSIRAGHLTRVTGLRPRPEGSG